VSEEDSKPPSLNVDKKVSESDDYFFEPGREIHKSCVLKKKSRIGKKKRTEGAKVRKVDKEAGSRNVNYPTRTKIPNGKMSKIKKKAWLLNTPQCPDCSKHRGYWEKTTFTTGNDKRKKAS